MKKLQRDLEKAVKECEVKITPELISMMTPVPPLDEIPTLREEFTLSLSSDPFSIIKTFTPTCFCHVRLCFDTSSIPLELRSYWVLFQVFLLPTSYLMDCLCLQSWSWTLTLTTWFCLEGTSFWKWFGIARRISRKLDISREENKQGYYHVWMWNRICQFSVFLRLLTVYPQHLCSFRTWVLRKNVWSLDQYGWFFSSSHTCPLPFSFFNCRFFSRNFRFKESSQWPPI